MQFFFVPDHRQNFRFFSSEPLHDIQVEFSRWKKLWVIAKEKLMLLPPPDPSTGAGLSEHHQAQRSEDLHPLPGKHGG